jgi:hypothetical protein
MSSGTIPRLYYKPFGNEAPAKGGNVNNQAETHSADEPAFGAFVAIDWADRKHVWSMQAAGSERRQHGEILHTPEAI